MNYLLNDNYESVAIKEVEMKPQNSKVQSKLTYNLNLINKVNLGNFNVKEREYWNSKQNYNAGEEESKEAGAYYWGSGLPRVSPSRTACELLGKG